MLCPLPHPRIPGTLHAHIVVNHDLKGSCSNSPLGRAERLESNSTRRCMDVFSYSKRVSQLGAYFKSLVISPTVSGDGHCSV